jgi:ribosomal protein L44E
LFFFCCVVKDIVELWTLLPKIWFWSQCGQGCDRYKLLVQRTKKEEARTGWWGEKRGEKKREGHGGADKLQICSETLVRRVDGESRREKG